MHTHEHTYRPTQLFDNPLSKCPIFRRILECSDFFELYTKIKKVPGITFGADFLHVFSIKTLLI